MSSRNDPLCPLLLPPNSWLESRRCSSHCSTIDAVKVLPFPTSLRSLIFPCMSSHSFWLMPSPSPVPGTFCEVEVCTCSYMMKTRAWSFLSMPIPSSCTLTFSMTGWRYILLSPPPPPPLPLTLTLLLSPPLLLSTTMLRALLPLAEVGRVERSSTAVPAPDWAREGREVEMSTSSCARAVSDVEGEGERRALAWLCTSPPSFFLPFLSSSAGRRGRRVAYTYTFRPFGVNFFAFDTKLTTTCVILC
mmetsp:Transcript_35354/g.91942  ORF Transcript_35354/g.91942 Transcript_35354/m.91942 type:complete len:247 (-) Transcript_35354:1635-2375(-)